MDKFKFKLQYSNGLLVWRDKVKRLNTNPVVMRSSLPQKIIWIAD